MKKRNRLLAILLTAIMTISMLPSAAFATEAVDTGETAESAVVEVSSIGEEQDAEAAVEEVSAVEEAVEETVEAAVEDEEAEAEETVAEEEEAEEAAEPTADQEEAAAEETAAPAEEETDAPAEAEETAAPAEEETVEPAIEAEEETVPEEAAVTVEWPVTLESMGEDYIVTASFDETAGFPADVKMNVSEIKKSSDAYQDYYDQALEAVQNETDKDVELTYARFFDVTFHTEEGEVEPTGPVNVSIKYRKAIEVESKDDVHVLHFDDNDNAAPQVMDIETDGRGEKVDEVSFETNGFSVYAVIGTTDPDNGDNARMTVNFIGADGNAAGTMIVKNADKSNLDSIIYDPGAGTIDEGYVFYGWSVDDRQDKDGQYYADEHDGADYTADTEIRTMDQVKTYISGLLSTEEGQGITEGDVLNIYAAVFANYTIEYFNNKGISLGSESKKVRHLGDSVNYTVNMGYNVDDTHKFEGWIPDSEADKANIIGYPDGAKPTLEDESVYYYENATQISIKGDVKFRVSAPEGNWLIFDENGEGASYNAPQFVRSGQVTKEPTVEMTRYGYTFSGWYKDKACSDGQEFTFGDSIAQTTTIYAKWIPNETAFYTVLTWRQKVSGNGYDFAESKIISGASVGSTITVTTDETSATVAGNTYNYDGFKFGRYEYNNEDGTISPEGTSVVNIYFDRNEYTLSFQIRDYIYTETTGNQGTQYGYYNGEYVELYYNNGTWYRNRSWRFGRWQYSDPYEGTRYTRSSQQQWYSIKEIKALYEQNIRDQFPIVGTNGVTYDNGERWSPQNDSEWTQVMVYVETMPSRNVVFHLDDPGDRPWKTMYYYVEALEGDEDTRTYNGKQYTKFNEVKARYNGVTEEDFVKLEAFDKLEAADEDNKKLELFESGGINWYQYDSQNDQTIYFYYTRKAYRINYMDSVYVDGYNNVIESVKTQLHTSDLIEYGADISEEGNYIPTLPSSKKGFVFEGWFIDEACTTKYVFDTMPSEGVTVYAKWRQIQYRVFLHPNVPVSDETLTWGSDDQGLSFRVSYGEKVSVPTGKRDHYEFLGWYSDEELTSVFNANAFVLNETTVTKDYDKSVDITDPEKRPWGIYSSDPDSDLYDPEVTLSNSDLTGWDDDNNESTPGKERYWIQKKLDLYAKWSEITEGAEGINIIYDENTEGGGKEGTAPIDNNKYKDNTQAVAGAASKPEDANNKVFSHWVVQKWDTSTNTFVDTSETALAGGQFTVHVADARKEAALDEGGQVIPDRYVYTIQLRAEYKNAKEDGTPTHIPWYKNDGTKAFHIDTIDVETQTIDQSTLSINKEVPIQPAQKREGYKFLGWSTVAMGNTEQAVKTWEGTESNWTQEDLVSKQDHPVEPNFLYYNDGKFYTDSSFTNEVTKVAADQKTPFHALFAVWEKIPGYWVYHSTGGDPVFYKLDETRPVLTDIVKKGYLYGGYYTSVKTDDSYEKGKAYKESWNSIDLSQHEDEVFYLKEVPGDYLKPQIYLIRNKVHNNLIQKLYGFVNVDSDEDYEGRCGLIVNGEVKAREALVNTSIVFKKNGATYRELKAEDLFAGMATTDPCTCYIGYRDLSTFIDGGANLQISGYYETQDGIRVTGFMNRVIKFPAGDSRYNNKPLWTGWGSVEEGKTYCNLEENLEGGSCTVISQSATSRMMSVRKFTVSAPSDKIEYTITKVYDSGTEEQVVEAGNYTGQITYMPKDGYMFAGWYQDEDFTVPADFADVTGNMTVYAKYISNKDITVAFSRKSKKSNTTTFNATISVKNRDQLENVTVNVDDDISTVLATKSVKKTGSGKNVKYTTQYKGTVAVKGLSIIDTFTASVSWTTPDGTLVTGANKKCTYILGIVTVK